MLCRRSEIERHAHKPRRQTRRVDIPFYALRSNNRLAVLLAQRVPAGMRSQYFRAPGGRSLRELTRDLAEVVGLCVEALLVGDGAVVESLQLRQPGEGEGVAVRGRERLVIGGDEGGVKGV